MTMANRLARQESTDLAKALQVEVLGAGRGKVRIVDDDSSVIVPADIDASSLLAVIDHGRIRFKAGYSKGCDKLKAELCRLIGAQRAPDEEAHA